MADLLNILYATWNQIVYAVTHMRPIIDLVDIFVIAFIIYKAIGFFRETRAGQLLKGIVILLIIYGLSSWLELVSIKWILSNVMNWAIFAILIIFQPELRHALEKVGRSKFGRFIPSVKSDNDSIKKSIDDICIAADNMHTKKIGALIVFERVTQLGETIATGTVVNSDVSVQMTENIFFPKSPLHDGALIVRDGRLYAAGCILPLTSNNNINSQYGTRHRAAIGMSENSDAVVLVVSEETGKISLACDGKIKSGYDIVSLKDALYELLLTSDQNSVGDKNVFSRFFSKLPSLSGKKGGKS